jgi:hypothetical protein
VPLVYGRCWVGPTVVSASLETGDEKINTPALGGGGGPYSPSSGTN